MLREKASSVNWNELQDDDINVYANNITNTILEISKQCIPNKVIRVRSSDPPWITNSLKRYIRVQVTERFPNEAGLKKEMAPYFRAQQSSS